jgi:hypothetical protein
MKRTYVGANVEVLEVVGVLPDIDADDRDVGQERVLVGGRGDLELLGRRVESLQHDRVRSYKRNEEFNERTSQPQPEPWTAAVVVLNCFLNESSEPKDSSIAVLSGPSTKIGDVI